jgi:lipoate---protein ligase
VSTKAAGPGRADLGPWRVVPLETGAPRDLLERSAALLDAAARDGVPTLRWYRASSPAVVLGRGQRDVPVAADDMDVVDRHSGGGAVLLTPDILALDVAVPMGHPLLDGDVSSAFLPVGRAWCEALTDLGVPDLVVHDGPAQATRRGDARQRLLAAVCYATLGRGEVAAGGRKLVGLSQRRRRAGALVQCGLLRRWDPAPLLTALGADPRAEEIAAAALGLDDLLDDAPADDTIVRVVSARLAG